MAETDNGNSINYFGGQNVKWLLDAFSNCI